MKRWYVTAFHGSENPPRAQAVHEQAIVAATQIEAAQQFLAQAEPPAPDETLILCVMDNSLADDLEVRELVRRHGLI